MKAALWISLSLIVMIAGLSFREWLIQEEISTLRVELKDQIQDGIRQSQSLERLAEFKKVQSVNERYLEPVVLAASRLLIPGSAQKEILSWRRDLHSTLTDQMYLREISLLEKFSKDIDDLKSKEKPGMPRLQNVLAMTEVLESSIERTKLVKAELEAIQEANKKSDQEALEKLKSAGKTSLSLLRKKTKGLGGQGLANYLTSISYEKEIESPVLSLVFSIKNPQLRQTAWDEYNSARRKIFQGRFKAVAISAGSTKENPAPTSSVAEVLKKEYDREVLRERLSELPANESNLVNPNDSKADRDPEILELHWPNTQIGETGAWSLPSFAC